MTIACGPDEDIFAADAPAPPTKTESACGDDEIRKEPALPPKPAPEQTEDQAQAYVEENENYMEQVQTNLILNNLINQRPRSSDLERRKELIQRVLQEEDDGEELPEGEKIGVDDIL